MAFWAGGRGLGAQSGGQACDGAIKLMNMIDRMEQRTVGMRLIWLRAAATNTVDSGLMMTGSVGSSAGKAASGTSIFSSVASS